MHMIGNAHDADLALTDHDSLTPKYLLSADGSTRMVYLINGVVYKVEAWDGINETEFDTIINNDLPAGVFYPEVSLFTISGRTVIAMEYVEGTPIYQCLCDMTGDVCDSVCMTPQEADFLCPLLDDPSGFNIIRNEHGYYIIDAA